MTVYGLASAALTNELSVGAVKLTVGAELSTSTCATTAEACTLPAQSVAVARTWYSPSATVCVSQADGTVCQDEPPCGATS